MAQKTPMKEESTYSFGDFSVSANQMEKESTYKFGAKFTVTANQDLVSTMRINIPVNNGKFSISSNPEFTFSVRNNPPINEKIESTYYYANTRKVLINVFPDFFQLPYHNQRKAIRMLIWWAIKQYFKTLFKK
jgi:hypothetical protein